MRATWPVVACLVAGCQTSGAVQLTLDLPADPALQPTGMTTITVTATGSDGVPVSTTSELDATGNFTAGDIPVGNGVQIDVLLRDSSSRLVGVGEASRLANISGTQTTSIALPVRRPFVYAATPDALISFDTTIDARDAKFQASVDGITAPLFAVSVGGDRLAVVSASSVQAIDTSTNQLVGDAIALPGAANDATAVPGTHQIAVAMATGIAIVDVDTGAVATSSSSASVDRVTVGADAHGVQTAYGLVGRVVAPVGPLDGCTGTSQLVSVPVATPGTLSPIDLTDGISDLAADPSAGLLFATAPCTGKVFSVDASGNLTQVGALQRAAVLSVLGGRIWAAGSQPSTPACLDDSGDTVACTLTSDESCPPPTKAVDSFIGFVNDGANLIVESIPTQKTETTDDTVTFDVPGRRETIVNTDDDAQQHAQVLKAFATAPLDLVALPGGQYVALVVQSSYFIQQLGNQQEILLPCLKATTGDWLLMDMASLSVADRVRTECDLTTGPSDAEFQHWQCDTPAVQETSTQGDYLPTSVGALFGAR